MLKPKFIQNLNAVPIAQLANRDLCLKRENVIFIINNYLQLLKCILRMVNSKKRKQHPPLNKAKILVIFHYKNKFKQGGKVKIDISQYMNQQLQTIVDQKMLLECPDKNAYLKFEMQFKQAFVNQKDKELHTTIQETKQPKLFAMPQQQQTISLDNQQCTECKKLKEEIEQMNQRLQSMSQRTTLSQRDSLNQNKMALLENEIKCQYQKERELKQTNDFLEGELLKQKRIVASIMQECLLLGDSKIIEIIENVIQQF